MSHASSRSSAAGLTANCYVRILYFSLVYVVRRACAGDSIPQGRPGDNDP